MSLSEVVVKLGTVTESFCLLDWSGRRQVINERLAMQLLSSVFRTTLMTSEESHECDSSRANYVIEIATPVTAHCHWVVTYQNLRVPYTESLQNVLHFSYTLQLYSVQSTINEWILS